MRGTILIREVDVTPLVHAIERAAIREHAIPKTDMVARLDCILHEFANILAAFIEYKRACIAAEAAQVHEAEEHHAPKGTVLQ